MMKFEPATIISVAEFVKFFFNLNTWENGISLYLRNQNCSQITNTFPKEVQKFKPISVLLIVWMYFLKKRKTARQVKGSPGTAVKLLPCDHEIGPFPRPCASGSYVHQLCYFIK
jgi:hypothetical protein